MTLDNKTFPTINPNTNRFNANQGYLYDKNGNLISDAEGRSFVFNGENKQAKIIKDGKLIGEYDYNGEGQRVRKRTYDANGALQDTTVFVYSAGKLVAEYSTAAPPENPTTRYTATDMLGSPRVITDSQGNVIARRDFKPFGEEITNNTGERTVAANYGVADNLKQKFTTYQRDDESGLDFAEARMYENRHGRFTAVDPLLASGKSANPQTFNRYGYVENSPIISGDPSGLAWFWRTDPKNGDRKEWEWFDDKPDAGGNWQEATFDAFSDFMKLENADRNGESLGTVYLHRTSNNYLTQSQYDSLQSGDGNAIGIPLLLFRISSPGPILPMAWRQMSRSNRDRYMRGIPNGGCCGWRPSPTFRGPIGPLLPQQQAEFAQRTLELRLRETIIVPIGPPRPVSTFPGQYARHHIFPQSREFAQFFDKAGIDVNQFTIVVPREHHIATHSGIGQGSGGWWNNQWRIFKENNPRATKAEIFQQANRMILQQQLMGPIQNYRVRIPDMMGALLIVLPTYHELPENS